MSSESNIPWVNNLCKKHGNNKQKDVSHGIAATWLRCIADYNYQVFVKTNYEPFDERVNWISHSDYYFFESIQNITHQRVYIKRFLIRAINFLIWIPKLFSRRLKSPSQRLHSLHLMPFLWIVPVEGGSYIWKFDKQKSWESVFNLTRAQIISWRLRKGWSRVISSWSTNRKYHDTDWIFCILKILVCAMFNSK